MQLKQNHWGVGYYSSVSSIKKIIKEINMYLYAVILTHVVFALGFQYTGNIYFLIPGSLVLVYQMWSFTKVAALVLSPDWIIEVEYSDTSFGEKMLLQLASILTMYFLYIEGYQLFVGATAFLSFITIVSALLTVLGVDMEEGDDE